MSLRRKLSELTTRRAVIGALFGFLAFVLGALLLVAFFHPTDQRLPESLPLVDANPEDAVKLTHPLSTGKSLLQGDLGYSFEDPKGWLKSRDSSVHLFGENDASDEGQAIRELFDSRIVLSSARFKSPDQISASFGVYPSRVEQRDGLMIPPRGSLTFNIDGSLGGGEVRFHVASVTRDSNLVIAIGGAQGFDWHYRWSLTQTMLNWLGGHFPALTKFLVKNYVQYLMPVKGASFATGRQWHKIALELSAADSRMQSSGAGSKQTALSRNITIRCAGDVPCIISDVTFYPHLSAEALDRQRENYVVVLIDTLRTDAVSSEGGNAEFRKFVDQSASFSNALSPGNMTSPSTNSLLACRIPTAIKDIAFAYAIDNESREKWYQQRIKSFPALFANQGYSTAMMGNISVISEVIGGGVHHGFSENISIETEGYETALTALEAARWIRTHRNEPFFLYVHLNAPHAPYKAPLVDILANWRGFEDLGSMANALRWLYRAEVSYSARSFAKIFEEIESSGIRNRTHVILLADHGDQHHDRWFLGNEASPKARGAFFDHGATLLNDEIGVPLVWHGPGIRAANHRRFVSTLGLGPALLQSAGVAYRGACGSTADRVAETIARAILDPAPIAATPVIGSEGYKSRAIVFDGRWKYIRSHEPTSKKLVLAEAWTQRRFDLFVREELYDLEGDPDEIKNLISQRPNYPRLESKAQQELGALIKRARRQYDRFYGVKSGFQLVIDNPLGEKVSVPVLQHESEGERRIVLPIPDRLPIHGLRVFVGLKPLALKATPWRLPINFDQWRTIPRSVAGEAALLPVAHQPQAYLIRAILNDGEVRSIAVGNPMFDQILREWGYLHDD